MWVRPLTAPTPEARELSKDRSSPENGHPGATAAGAILKCGSFAQTSEQKSCTYRLVAGQG